MTWLAPGEPTGKLMFSRFSGQGWGPPVTVAPDVSLLGPVDPAALTVLDTRGVRRTLIARTGNTIARSGDGGRTWSRLPSGPLPFASFAGGDEGGYAFWLAEGGSGATRLVGTRILAGETVLDPEVAAGELTAAAMTWDGPLVVYRDLLSGGSGLAAVRRQKGHWETPKLIWRPAAPAGRGSSIRSAAAPVVKAGLAMAAFERQVAVAWLAEEAAERRLLVAFSTDAGRTFGAPIAVDRGSADQGPSGAVSLALLDDGEAAVLWRATHDRHQARLLLARVAVDGRRGQETVVSEGPAVRLWGMPQLVRAGGQLAFTWIEGVLAQVHAATLPIAALAAAVHPAAEIPAAKAAAYVGAGRVGDGVPQSELVDLAGEKVSLAKLRGRVVLLNLWATWCLPCITEMPELTALAQRFEAQGLTVVGLNVDASGAAEKVRRFVAERQLSFAIWLDPEMQVAGDLRAQSLPVTFVLDRDGQIVRRLDRPITAADPELLEALRRALR